jgi:hypothetical protein
MGCTESTPAKHTLLDERGNITENTAAAREAKVQHDMERIVADLERYVGTLEAELPLKLVSKIKAHRAYIKDLKGELKVWADSEAHEVSAGQDPAARIEKDPFKRKELQQAERELNLRQMVAFPTEFSADGSVPKPVDIFPPQRRKGHVLRGSRPRLRPAGAQGGGGAMTSPTKTSKRGSSRKSGGGGGIASPGGGMSSPAAAGGAGAGGMASPPQAPGSAQRSGSFSDVASVDMAVGQVDAEASMFCGARVPDLVREIHTVLEEFCPHEASKRDPIFARLGRIMDEGRRLYARKQEDAQYTISRDPGFANLTSELDNVIGREVKVTLCYTKKEDAEKRSGIIFQPRSATAVGLQQVTVSRVGLRAGMQQVAEAPEKGDIVRILDGPGAGSEAKVVDKAKDDAKGMPKGAKKYRVEGQSQWYGSKLVPKVGHGWTFPESHVAGSCVKKGDRLIKIGTGPSNPVENVHNLTHDQIMKKLAVLKDQHGEDSVIDMYFLAYRESQVDEEHYPHCGAYDAAGELVEEAPGMPASPHVGEPLYEPEDVYRAARLALPQFSLVLNEVVCRAAENDRQLNESGQPEDTVARVMPLKPFFSTCRRQALRLDGGFPYRFETATDIVRGSVVADSCHGLIAVLRHLKALESERRVRIVRIENYFTGAAGEPARKDGCGEAVLFLQCLNPTSHFEKPQNQLVCELRLVHRAMLDVKQTLEYVVRGSIDEAEEIVEFTVGHVLLERMRRAITEASTAYNEQVKEGASREDKERCRTLLRSAAQSIQALRSARLLCAVNGRAFRVVGEELCKDNGAAWINDAMTQFLKEDRTQARALLDSEQQKALDLQLCQAANEPAYSVKVDAVLALLMKGADPNAKADPAQAAEAAKARLAKASKIAHAKAVAAAKRQAATPGAASAATNFLFDARRSSFFKGPGSNTVQNYQLAHPHDPSASKAANLGAKPQAAGAHALDAHAATQQYTALVAACRQGHRAVVEKLLDHGAYIDTADMAGDYPVVVAATYGRYEILQVLIERGADLETNDVGREAINMAARHPKCLRFLQYAASEKKARPRSSSNIDDLTTAQ